MKLKKIIYNYIRLSNTAENKIMEKKHGFIFFYKKLFLLIIFDFNNKVNTAYCKFCKGKLKSEAKEEIK